MAEDKNQKPAKRRRGVGRPFAPGTSGNPKGRPRLGESLAEVIRQKWPPEKLVDAMGKHADSSNEMVAIRAKEWLAERGYGGVPKDVNMDVHAVGPEAQAMLGALVLTPEQRRSRADALRRKAMGGVAPSLAVVAPVLADADE